MSRILSPKLAQHRFLSTLDFRPVTFEGVTYPDVRVARKNLVADNSVVEIKEDKEPSTLRYGFSKEENRSNYISFRIDPKSEKCIEVLGHWDSPALTVVHKNDGPTPSAQEIFTEFLHNLKNVFTSARFEGLIHKTLLIAPKANIAAPGFTPSGP